MSQSYERRQKRALKKINTVLGEYKVGLTAMLDFTPQGIVPKVAFVDLQEKPSDKQAQN
jgi:hypothetical protein